MTKNIAIFAALALGALLAGMLYVVFANSNGFLAHNSDDQFASCRATSVAGAGDIGGPLELVNSNGETVTDQEIFTEPSLVYFGFTFCPDVCPLDTARNAVAVDILEEKGISVRPVFISIDPERDTPEVVGEYAEIIHDRMLGLTGSLEQVKAASQAYKTYYKKQPGDDEFYLVDHSTFTYLVMPETGFAEFYRRDMTPEAMAESVQCFVDAA